VNEAIASYKTYVVEQVGETITATKLFTDAVRAGDVAAAKAQYAPSRQGWERIGPIAGLVDVLDGRLDARVDDFDNESDPDFTGWHRLEYHLFSLGSTNGTVPFADQLDADLVTLDEQIRALTFPALEVTLGPGELIDEASKGKIAGEVDRYSGTDLWDLGANVEGSDALFGFLEPALEAKDPGLVDRIEPEFAAVDASLAEYRNPDGSYKNYSELTEDDKSRMGAELSVLAESLSLVPGTLGLE
jgi:iron uptake system component EfeO